MTRNIILTGFMGSGKSTVGAYLAERFGCPVLDTDRWIEDRIHKPIARIFAEEGEEFFRDLETECLREQVKNRGRGIISAGGGMPVREENRMLLSRLGTVVYLYVSPEGVYERLKNDKTRPLLAASDPRKRIEELWNQREKLYRMCADAVIMTEGRRTREIAEEIGGYII